MNDDYLESIYEAGYEDQLEGVDRSSEFSGEHYHKYMRGYSESAADALVVQSVADAHGVTK